ncbi:MAG: hypothetical protein RLZ91_938 [Bacteroidota bacterium]
MKIKQLLFWILCFASLELRAQQTTSEKLYPIEQIQQGFSNKYVYKRQVIENPLALQIPLLEAKDPEVSLEFNTFKRQRKLMTWISSAGLGVSFYSLLNPGHVTDGFYLSAIGTAALVNFYVGTVSMRHLKRALIKYNSLAGEDPKISFEIKTHGAQGASLALNWKYNF